MSPNYFASSRSTKHLVLTNFQNEFFNSVLPKYPPPSRPFSRSFQMIDLINTACSENYLSKVLVGDFNIPEIDSLSWNTVKSESHYSFKFLECLRDNYLEQLVQMQTRWRDQQPGNLSYLVLTDFEDSILNLESTNNLGNSDYLSLECLINCITENYVNDIEKRNFYRANYVSANQKNLKCRMGCII